jgi:c-di-GMP-binding flagellar brake protein YcgR
MRIVGGQGDWFTAVEGEKPMEDPEKIEDKNMLNLLKALQKDKTLIKMNLPGRDFERITIITRVRHRRQNPVFLIDYTKGFREAVGDVKDVKMHFEFTREDKVNYYFNAYGWEIYSDEIGVRFPEFIERIQRRKDFRLAVPTDTKLLSQLDSTRLEMKVLNVSLGGTLALLVGRKESLEEEPIFNTGEYLSDIEMVFSLEEGDLRIHIERAMVVRLEENPSTKKNYCALQFVSMEEKEEKTLTEFIYKYQRRILQKKQQMKK